MADSFYEVLTKAVKDMAEHGYDSEERLRYWQQELERAMARSLPSEEDLARLMREGLQDVFLRLVSRGGVLKRHPGVALFRLEQISPALRGELDRRVLAAAGLIKLNRAEMIERTLRRFTGYATSIPAGGSPEPKRAEAKRNIVKSMRSLPFEERRLLIDQGHKLAASIDRVVADQNGAIAAKWHSHWRQAGYNYRPDHKERDGHIYLIRGSKYQELGLVKPGPDGYSDQITAPAEEPFCRCSFEFIYSLREVPLEMLTAQGREKLAEMDANKSPR